MYFKKNMNTPWRDPRRRVGKTRSLTDKPQRTVNTGQTAGKDRLRIARAVYDIWL
jgi:hypothetical protein